MLTTYFCLKPLAKDTVFLSFEKEPVVVAGIGECHVCWCCCSAVEVLGFIEPIVSSHLNLDKVLIEAISALVTIDVKYGVEFYVEVVTII